MRSLTALPTAPVPSPFRRVTLFRKPGRDVALLAEIQIVWVIILTRLEPRFFIIYWRTDSGRHEIRFADAKLVLGKLQNDPASVCFV